MYADPVFVFTNEDLVENTQVTLIFSTITGEQVIVANSLSIQSDEMNITFNLTSSFIFDVKNSRLIFVDNSRNHFSKINKFYLNGVRVSLEELKKAFNDE